MLVYPEGRYFPSNKMGVWEATFEEFSRFFFSPGVSRSSNHPFLGAEALKIKKRSLRSDGAKISATLLICYIPESSSRV